MRHDSGLFFYSTKERTLLTVLLVSSFRSQEVDAKQAEVGHVLRASEVKLPRRRKRYEDDGDKKIPISRTKEGPLSA